MTAPVIALGLGSTKSGTSWLYESLAAHPQVHFRSIKELHWFDTVERGRSQQAIQGLSEEIAGMEGRLAKAPEARIPCIAARIADRRAYIDTLHAGTDDAYLDYLHDGAGEARVIGDVTPSYAIQGAQVLRRMARMAADVRAIYLMRDPVERLWSHVRMIARRRGDGTTVDPARARNILTRVLDGKEHEIAVRGDYAAALARIEDAFAPARRWIGTFDHARGAAGWASICGFLGLDAHPATTDIIHGGAPLAMTAEDRARAREWLAPQYDAVARRMTLPNGWARNDAQAQA